MDQVITANFHIPTHQGASNKGGSLQPIRLGGQRNEDVNKVAKKSLQKKQ